MGPQNADFGPLIWLNPRMFWGSAPWTPTHGFTLDQSIQGFTATAQNWNLAEHFPSWFYAPKQYFFQCPDRTSH